jgi:F0F1-type ATP synthase membrane subunit c/vacuolar-type H+-ATPase subunit K
VCACVCGGGCVRACEWVGVVCVWVGVCVCARVCVWVGVGVGVFVCVGARSLARMRVAPDKQQTKCLLFLNTVAVP